MNYRSYLQHYGIKGMKWGVRRTPEQLGHVRIRYSYSPLELTTPKERWIISQKYWSYKNSTIGHVVRAFSNLGYFPDNTVKTDGPVERLNEMKKKDPSDVNILNDLRNVNPRPLNVPVDGTTSNCGFCAIAMEMRRRGYDVRARKANRGMTLMDVAKVFRGVSMGFPTKAYKQEGEESIDDYKKRAYSDMCKYIEKQGAGASGMLGLTFESGTGHFIYYQVDKNGSVNFYDGQSKDVNNNLTFTVAKPSEYKVLRLDTAEPNPDLIGCITVSINKKKGDAK